MSPGTPDRDRVAKALEVALFAPLGLGLYLKDMAPTFLNMFVARGRAEVDKRQEKVEERVKHAKGMGEVAIAFGVPMLRKRAEEKIGEARGRAESALRSAGVGRGATVAEPRPASQATPRQRTHAPAPTVVPVARADNGPPGVSDGSEPTSRDGGSPRSAASADLPIPGYDALSASQVVERLSGLGSAELLAVREYETAHRNRRTILGKIDQLTG